MHLSLLMAGASRLNLDRAPNMVPTGQTVLHHVLPFFHARAKISLNATIEAMRVGSVPTHTSVL